MKTIHIESTTRTPEVILDSANRAFFLQGRSHSETISEFFNSLIPEIKQTLDSLLSEEEDKKFSFHFNLEYYSSTSAKHILDFVKIIKSLSQKGLEAKVFWHYESDDEEMYEAGQNFAFASDLDFNFIEN